jgi:hypothetical protein
MSIVPTRIRRFSIVLTRSAAICLLALCSFGPLAAQGDKANLPDPVKFRNKFDIVANAVREVLKENHDIKLDDRKAGIITTQPYEFISGSLTADEVSKVAINKSKDTGYWLKAQYSIEAQLEIVSPAETLVTIHTNIEALNRDLDGTETWVPMESRGVFEKRILGKISGILMGKQGTQKNEGFWGQRPQPVDPRRSRFPVPPDR